MVIPGLFFTILAIWPLLEARVTRDQAAHNLLDRPRDSPGRSSWGAAGLGFMTVLTLAGSNDVLAKFLGVDVDALNVALKAMVLAVPPLAAFATYRICGDLRARELHPIVAPRRATFRRTADGGFEEESEAGEPTSGSRA